MYTHAPCSCISGKDGIVRVAEAAAAAAAWGSSEPAQHFPRATIFHKYQYFCFSAMRVGSARGPPSLRRVWYAEHKVGTLYMSMCRECRLSFSTQPRFNIDKFIHVRIRLFLFSDGGASSGFCFWDGMVCVCMFSWFYICVCWFVVAGIYRQGKRCADACTWKHRKLYREKVFSFSFFCFRFLQCDSVFYVVVVCFLSTVLLLKYLWCKYNTNWNNLKLPLNIFCFFFLLRLCLLLRLSLIYSLFEPDMYREDLLFYAYCFVFGASCRFDATRHVYIPVSRFECRVWSEFA